MTFPVTAKLCFLFFRKQPESIISQTYLPTGRFRASAPEENDGVMSPEENSLLRAKMDG
jgi:hypothetical protein